MMLGEPLEAGWLKLTTTGCGLHIEMVREGNQLASADVNSQRTGRSELPGRHHVHTVWIVCMAGGLPPKETHTLRRDRSSYR